MSGCYCPAPTRIQCKPGMRLYSIRVGGAKVNTVMKCLRTIKVERRLLP